MHSNFADLHAQPRFEKKLDAAGNAACTLTVAADPDNFWVLDWIAWSYSGDPTGGKCTVSIGGVNVFEVDVTSGGPGLLHFDQHELYNASQTKNEALQVTLAAGGGSVVGKLQIRYR